MVNYIVKLAVTVIVIISAAQIGKKAPSLGGLIATMPLTSLLVLMWLYLDEPGNYDLLAKYTAGALWGIIPSVLFFAAAHLCLQRHLPLPVALSIAFGI